jgi:phosphatidylserine/phosphatidylglycerophosphate/cardiolipin synthase-like enzyme
MIFFMERMQAGVGRGIGADEAGFLKLRAEWMLCRTIASGMQGSSVRPGVFLPANPSGDYEGYVAAPTTGRITLLLNGRSRGGPGPPDNAEAFSAMQESVESLGRGDSILLANWQFTPTATSLTKKRPDMATWGELLNSKAEQGVVIRVIISDLPTPDFRTDLGALDALIGGLSASARDNFKYIMSRHPLFAVVHHQKLMIIRKGCGETIAYCGGLDISFRRNPLDWTKTFRWHDIHARLEGLIARDLEREFVLRWNREKSTAAKLPGWRAFEKLGLSRLDSGDRSPARNTHKLQMLRTVSLGAGDIRRDDIWQGYFRLIGCATRFIFLENQYFHEPALADAIVLQAQARPELLVIVVVSSRTDDPDNAFTENCRALRSEFFTRLFDGLSADRRGVYTMPTPLVHSKLALADDQFLTIGSANANPRGFFLDTELNVMLDDKEAVTGFRHRLWALDLGMSPSSVAAWKISDFIPQWDRVAKANEGLKILTRCWEKASFPSIPGARRPRNSSSSPISCVEPSRTRGCGLRVSPSYGASLERRGRANVSKDSLRQPNSHGAFPLMLPLHVAEPGSPLSLFVSHAIIFQP